MRFKKILPALLVIPLYVACTNGKTQFMDQRMGFFVTSVGFSDAAGNAIGGSWGGITPADEKCQALAVAAGNFGHKTWHAYLSYHASNAAGDFANARDRIGAGPWYNAHGEILSQNVDTLHTISPAAHLFLTEQGNLVSSGEYMITGTDAEGILLFNCGSYMRNDSGALMAFGRPLTRWNYESGSESSCEGSTFQSVGSKGRFYCFAAD